MRNETCFDIFTPRNLSKTRNILFSYFGDEFLQLNHTINHPYGLKALCQILGHSEFVWLSNRRKLSKDAQEPNNWLSHWSNNRLEKWTLWWCLKHLKTLRRSHWSNLDKVFTCTNERTRRREDQPGLCGTCGHHHPNITPMAYKRPASCHLSFVEFSESSAFLLSQCSFSLFLADGALASRARPCPK